jgi:hypothetical protein
LLFIPDEEMLKKFDYVFLVFGVFDAISLYQLGYPAMTTLTGMIAKPEMFSSIRKKILIIPDKGEEKTMARLAAGLDWRGKVLRVDYPDDCKDVNDLLRTKKESILHGLASSIRN